MIVFIVVFLDRGTDQTGPAHRAVSLRLNFHLDPVPGFTVGSTSVGADGEGRQYLTKAHYENIGTVELTSPSIFDQMPLLGRQPITVAGHRAYFAQQRQVVVSHGPGPLRGTAAVPGTLPVIAWQVGTDRWLLVAPTLLGSATNPDVSAWGPDIRAELLEIAAAVHTDQSTTVLLPFRVTDAPRGMVATAANSYRAGADVNLTDGRVAFAVIAKRPVNYAPSTPGSVAVAVGRYSGRIDPSCGPSPEPSGPPLPQPLRSDCTLRMRVGAWEVAVSADAPNSAVSASTVIDLGAHLIFAATPGDTTTWFDATQVID